VRYRAGIRSLRGILTILEGFVCERQLATHGNGVRGIESPPMTEHLQRAFRFEPPLDCRRILIVGAGGFGREVLQWARDAWPGRASLVGGFLSDDPRRLDGFSCEVGIVSAVHDYRPAAGDYLLLGIGVPYSRRRVAEHLRTRDARFLTLVHPLAVVAESADLAEGSIVCPFAVISHSARLGRCVLVNYHASLGHDAVAGDFVVLSPYSTLGGGATVGDDAFLGLHASVGPAKTVGARSKVSANSCVLSDTPDDSLIYGVPGRILPRIEVGLS
jgi:sugar O-acyltransferase (sialic acid O-acetyltransferase NeuD family)